MARTVIPMDLGWKFHRGDADSPVGKSFDDQEWKTVTLPHDWSVEEPFSREHSSGGGYLPGGIGWYRGKALIPEALRGKHLTLEFDGVYNHSRVWVNGYYFGKHPYGYTPFAYDVTHTQTPDGVLCVAVRVHHEHTADSRWFTGSGITRRVRLTVQEDCRFARNGVFFAVTGETDKGLSLRLRTSVEKDAERDLICTFELTSPDGTILWKGEGKPVQATGTETLEWETVTDGPRWSPDDPALCTLRVTLSEGSEILDEETVPVGLRSIRFDPNEGFFLNGVNMKFKGICIHHDAGPLGAAVPLPVWERRLKLLKEMGCNAIRMSHNPQMTELYGLCDRMGFLVMDEAFDEWEGPKNKWWQGHNVYPPQLHGYFEDFPEWHEKDLRAMVERDRNHPSIVLWSIGNEIDYPNDPYCHTSFAEMTGNNDSAKPAAERRYNPDKPNAERIPVIAARLRDIVKSCDETRPVTAAIAYPELSNRTGYCDTVDVCGYNYKEQWYDEDHAKYPERILYGSENGQGYLQWKAVTDRPFIAGQFLWTGIDFFGETRLWPDHGSHAGLMTTAAFPKTSYFFRRSLWSDAPCLKLVSRPAVKDGNPWRRRAGENFGWNYAPGQEVEAVVYTNCPKVTLELNGEKLGEYAPDPETGCVEVPIAFREGKLTASCGDLKDSIETVGRAVSVSLYADRTELKADGTDVTVIEARLLDGSGRWVPFADEVLTVTATEGLEILALDSGNLLDTSDCKVRSRAAYEGRLIVCVRAGTKAGEEVLRVSVPGFEDKEIAVTLTDPS